MDEKTTNACLLVRKFKLFAVKHSLSFCSKAQPGWFVTTSWHTGSSLHDSFHSSLFHSWTDTSVSCWLTKRSVPLRSRCAFRNTARPASPGSVSVWYRDFWKLFTVLVKAWEDSVGTTQKLRFITTRHPPVRERPLENTHVPLLLSPRPPAQAEIKVEHPNLLSNEATTFLCYHKYIP